MKPFTITARTADGRCLRYHALATCSADAAADAAERFGDTPCGITVTCAG